MKGVVKVELDILDRVEMGRQLNGEVRLYSANNKVVFMASRDIMEKKAFSVHPFHPKVKYNILLHIVICLTIRTSKSMVSK